MLQATDSMEVTEKLISEGYLLEQKYWFVSEKECFSLFVDEPIFHEVEIPNHFFEELKERYNLGCLYHIENDFAITKHFTFN